ncbi:phospholipase D-like domain-containing protein [Comamonas endophytica]|uniref:Phospholipase D-like domain-containing protein n=2 Tax=Comamonas endophytica TaxID=2949090 RepID=A0ABY6G6N3_9BURK|nr:MULTISPECIES: phospholipase D-like domain-containing protein [unclassified Acidovorax]MCD2511288.1 phospholipase D-like domain-containing protein [Acidovorax sp. D4N7]UYG50682.1 phospholipase D-like domain-containing protein [Acidovorax sp. 5MLIR]
MTTFALLSGLGHSIVVIASLLVYMVATRIGHQRRHPSAALAWVVAMVAIPYVALPLFMLIGSRKFLRPMQRQAPLLPAPSPWSDADAQAGAAPPQWVARLLRALDLPEAMRNSHVQFQSGGDEALAALLATIDSAREQLALCTYVLAADATGEQVAQALQRCVARGVQVRVLIDAIGSLQTPRTLLRDWRGMGIAVRRFMPLLHNPLYGRLNLRNHRKLVVADARRIWSGGRNLADEYFVGSNGAPPWVDLGFVVEGPLAAQALAQFDADWRAAPGRIHRKKHRAPPVAQPAALAPAPGQTWAQWIASGPDHADDTLHALLLSAAFQARESIVAVTPYFVPDDALVAAWALACRRGVRLRLLLPRCSNHRLADWARERALRQLAQAGAEIHLLPAMLHAKCVIVDGEWALCGSLNLDARSLFLNYEAMAAFYGQAEVQWLCDWHEQLQAGAEPYVGRRPSWPREIFEGMVRTVAFQL